MSGKAGSCWRKIRVQQIWLALGQKSLLKCGLLNSEHKAVHVNVCGPAGTRLIFGLALSQSYWAPHQTRIWLATKLSIMAQTHENWGYIRTCHNSQLTFEMKQIIDLFPRKVSLSCTQSNPCTNEQTVVNRGFSSTNILVTAWKEHGGLSQQTFDFQWRGSTLLIARVCVCVWGGETCISARRWDTQGTGLACPPQSPSRHKTPDLWPGCHSFLLNKHHLIQNTSQPEWWRHSGSCSAFVRSFQSWIIFTSTLFTFSVSDMVLVQLTRRSRQSNKLENTLLRQCSRSSGNLIQAHRVGPFMAADQQSKLWLPMICVQRVECWWTAWSHFTHHWPHVATNLSEHTSNCASWNFLSTHIVLDTYTQHRFCTAPSHVQFIPKQKGRGTPTCLDIWGPIWNKVNPRVKRTSSSGAQFQGKNGACRMLPVQITEAGRGGCELHIRRCFVQHVQSSHSNFPKQKKAKKARFKEKKALFEEKKKQFLWGFLSYILV